QRASGIQDSYSTILNKTVKPSCGLVHLFPGSYHHVVHEVQPVGPATVVVDGSFAAAVPRECRLAHSSKLRVRRRLAVGVGDEYLPIDCAIATTAYRHDSLANDQDQPVETEVSTDKKRPSYNQHSSAAGGAGAKIAIYISYLWVGVCAVRW